MACWRLLAARVVVAPNISLALNSWGWEVDSGLGSVSFRLCAACWYLHLSFEVSVAVYFVKLSCAVKAMVTTVPVLAFATLASTVTIACVCVAGGAAAI